MHVKVIAGIWVYSRMFQGQGTHTAGSVGNIMTLFHVHVIIYKFAYCWECHPEDLIL